MQNPRQGNKNHFRCDSARLVIKIHNCLTLSKIITFYVVYGSVKPVTKTHLTWKFPSGSYSGSRWENPVDWNAHD